MEASVKSKLDYDPKDIKTRVEGSAYIIKYPDGMIIITSASNPYALLDDPLVQQIRERASQ